MKRIMTGILLAGLLVSCGNRKTATGSDSSDAGAKDSLTVQVDTLSLVKEPDEPQPTEADESFDDFIYNFASDELLQRQRVRFPLSYYQGKEKKLLEEKDWEHDDLFTNQNFYTLLFDREADMDLVGDTTLSSVQVEWIYIKKRMVKRYYFERIKGAWILEAINLRPIVKNESENFVEFFGKFVTDSIFQSQRVRNPLAFVTSDPDDDFAILETTIDRSQWFAFKPDLPTDRLSNINYGQKNDDYSSTKILALKGIGNGFSNILYFRRRAGKWEMYKFEDTSI